jgi:hypothetical protein
MYVCLFLALLSHEQMAVYTIEVTTLAGLTSAMRVPILRTSCTAGWLGGRSVPSSEASCFTCWCRHQGFVGHRQTVTHKER